MEGRWPSARESCLKRFMTSISTGFKGAPPAAPFLMEFRFITAPDWHSRPNTSIKIEEIFLGAELAPPGWVWVDAFHGPLYS